MQAGRSIRLLPNQLFLCLLLLPRSFGWSGRGDISRIHFLRRPPSRPPETDGGEGRTRQAEKEEAEKERRKKFFSLFPLDAELAY